MNATNMPRLAGGVLAILSAVFFAPPANSHTLHMCPAVLPDAPALSSHIEHADIVGGRLSFDEVVAHRAALFSARFNRDLSSLSRAARRAAETAGTDAALQARLRAARNAITQA